MGAMTPLAFSLNTQRPQPSTLYWSQLMFDLSELCSRTALDGRLARSPFWMYMEGAICQPPRKKSAIALLCSLNVRRFPKGRSYAAVTLNTCGWSDPYGLRCGIFRY